MAGHATLRALAEEHCFASNTGLAWRVANDMLRLPEPTMRQHFDGSDTKPYGEMRRRDDCPTAPASLIAFVVQGTRDSDTPDSPVWLTVAGLRDNRVGSEQQRSTSSTTISAQLRSGAALYATSGALLSASRPSAYMRTGWGGSDCSALGDTWALGHLLRPEPCPTRTPSAHGTAPRLSRRPVSVPRHNR